MSAAKATLDLFHADAYTYLLTYLVHAILFVYGLGINRGEEVMLGSRYGLAGIHPGSKYADTDGPDSETITLSQVTGNIEPYQVDGSTVLLAEMLSKNRYYLVCSTRLRYKSSQALAVEEITHGVHLSALTYGVIPRVRTVSVPTPACVSFS